MPPSDYRVRLYDFLNNRFSDDDVKDLCFRLDIEYENLLGGTRRNKIQQLIDAMDRLGRLPELITAIKHLRPNLAEEVSAIKLPDSRETTEQFPTRKTSPGTAPPGGTSPPVKPRGRRRSIGSIAIILVFIVGSAAYLWFESSSGPNLVDNSGFERPLPESRWQLAGPEERVTNSHTGDYALYSEQEKSVDQKPSWRGFRQHIDNITPGQDYNFTAWLKAECIEGEDCVTGTHFVVEWYDQQGNRIGSQQTIKVISETRFSWTQHGRSFTAPAEATSADIIIRHGVMELDDGFRNVPGSALWIDDVTFRPVN